MVDSRRHGVQVRGTHGLLQPSSRKRAHMAIPLSQTQSCFEVYAGHESDVPKATKQMILHRQALVELDAVYQCKHVQSFDGSPRHAMWCS